MGACRIDANVMNAPSTSAAQPSVDWLDSLLADEGAEHRADYIGDDGFTASVMQKLPAPVTAPAWRRPIVVALWLVAAAFLATMLPGTAYEVAREAFTLFAARPFALSTLAFVLVAIGVATWTATAVALRRD
jgi:hypothetical protein